MNGWPSILTALALAALASPSVATLVAALANGRKLEQVHQNTNGSLAELRAEIARLAAANDALQARLDKLLRPPGPV